MSAVRFLLFLIVCKGVSGTCNNLVPIFSRYFMYTRNKLLSRIVNWN